MNKQSIGISNIKYWTFITSLFSIAGSLFYFGAQLAKIAFYLGKITSEHQQIIEMIVKTCK